MRGDRSGLPMTKKVRTTGIFLAIVVCLSACSPAPLDESTSQQIIISTGRLLRQDSTMFNRVKKRATISGILIMQRRRVSLSVQTRSANTVMKLAMDGFRVRRILRCRQYGEII